MQLLQTIAGGFCIGGRVSADRQPRAFEVTYSPFLSAEPQPTEIPRGATRSWGCPNLIARLLFGIDDGLVKAIIGSGKWQRTPQDLVNLINPYILRSAAEFPLREAVDWIYSSIFITIKAMKFSSLSPVCGGDIEIALITSDRPFRWVCHKRMGAAVTPPNSGGNRHDV